MMVFPLLFLCTSVARASDVLMVRDNNAERSLLDRANELELVSGVSKELEWPDSFLAEFEKDKLPTLSEIWEKLFGSKDSFEKKDGFFNDYKKMPKSDTVKKQIDAADHTNWGTELALKLFKLSGHFDFNKNTMVSKWMPRLAATAEITDPEGTNIIWKTVYRSKENDENRFAHLQILPGGEALKTHLQVDAGGGGWLESVGIAEMYELNLLIRKLDVRVTDTAKCMQHNRDVEVEDEEGNKKTVSMREWEHADCCSTGVADTEDATDMSGIQIELVPGDVEMGLFNPNAGWTGGVFTWVVQGASAKVGNAALGYFEKNIRDALCGVVGRMVPPEETNEVDLERGDERFNNMNQLDLQLEVEYISWEMNGGTLEHIDQDMFKLYLRPVVQEQQKLRNLKYAGSAEKANRVGLQVKSSLDKDATGDSDFPLPMIRVDLHTGLNVKVVTTAGYWLPPSWDKWGAVHSNINVDLDLYPVMVKTSFMRDTCHLCKSTGDIDNPSECLTKSDETELKDRVKFTSNSIDWVANSYLGGKALDWVHSSQLGSTSTTGDGYWIPFLCAIMRENVMGPLLLGADLYTDAVQTENMARKMVEDELKKMAVMMGKKETEWHELKEKYTQEELSKLRNKYIQEADQVYQARKAEEEKWMGAYEAVSKPKGTCQGPSSEKMRYKCRCGFNERVQKEVTKTFDSGLLEGKSLTYMTSEPRTIDNRTVPGDGVSVSYHMNDNPYESDPDEDNLFGPVGVVLDELNNEHGCRVKTSQGFFSSLFSYSRKHYYTTCAAEIRKAMKPTSSKPLFRVQTPDWEKNNVKLCMIAECVAKRKCLTACAEKDIWSKEKDLKIKSDWYEKLTHGEPITDDALVDWKKTSGKWTKASQFWYEVVTDDVYKDGAENHMCKDVIKTGKSIAFINTKNTHH